MTTIRALFGVASRVTAKDFCAGLECEIENIESIHERIENEGYWSITTDGSLRNNGREFISKPLSKAKLLSEFDKLHNSLHYSTDEIADRFSARTSVHTHVNCLDLEDSQVKNIVLWYALFEPLFFLFAKPERRNNIHCVGLDQTILSHQYSKSLKMLHSKWSKYTALNIVPLNKYGTIEFRHLEGTDDQEKIKAWLDTLENLWAYGKTHEVNRMSVMNDAVVKEAFYAIFKDAPEIQKYSSILSKLLANSLVDIKLSLL